MHVSTGVVTAGFVTGRGRRAHLEAGAKKLIHDLVLLDGQREQVHLLHGLNLALLYKTAELGAGNPLVLILPLSAATATPPATVAATAPTAPIAAATPTVSKSTGEAPATTGCTSCRRCVSHLHACTLARDVLILCPSNC